MARLASTYACFLKIFVQRGEDALHGQADDIAGRAFNALDQTAPVFLSRITAGFVKDRDASQIVIEINSLPGTKFHTRGFNETAKLSLASLHETHAGQHFMKTATEPLSMIRASCRFFGFPKMSPSMETIVSALRQAIQIARRLPSLCVQH